MSKDITNDLRPAIARHLAACNGHDIDAWMATFDPDALVNDVQREFAGAEAIRAFAAKEIFGDRVTFTPLRAVDRHGDITVHARTDGTYDKTGLPDPLILSLYFSLREEPDHPVDHHTQQGEGLSMTTPYPFPTSADEFAGESACW